MLQVLATTKAAKSLSLRLTKTLEAILLEKGIIHTRGSLQALMKSFSKTEDWHPSAGVFTFIDSCMHRIVHKPIRYIDILGDAQRKNVNDTPLSLLACCSAEQWPYIVRCRDEKGMLDIHQWIHQFFWYLEQVEMNFQVLNSVPT